MKLTAIALTGFLVITAYAAKDCHFFDIIDIDQVSQQQPSNINDENHWNRMYEQTKKPEYDPEDKSW